MSEIEKPRHPYRKKGSPSMKSEETAVLDMIVRGMTHREIAAELGMSMGTVARRQATALARTHPTSVAEYRGVMNEQLDHLFQANVLRLESGDVGALDTALKILDRKAKLNGLDSPTVVDLNVVTTTAQERELADLLAKAEATLND